MKKLNFCGAIALSAASIIFSTIVHAGPIGLGGFGGGAATQTYEGLALPFSNPTPIVIGGDTYTTETGTLRYDTSFGGKAGGSGFGLGSNSELGWIDIVLGTAAFRAGLNFGDNVTWSGFAEFFDAGDTLLGTVGGAGSVGTFAGWEDAGLISRIRVTDSATNGRIIHIDNLITETAGTGGTVPEPTTVALMGLGLFGLGFMRKKAI